MHFNILKSSRIFYSSGRLWNAFSNCHNSGCKATPLKGKAIDMVELRNVVGTLIRLFRRLESGRAILKLKPLIVVSFIYFAGSLMLRELITATLTNVSLQAKMYSTSPERKDQGVCEACAELSGNTDFHISNRFVRLSTLELSTNSSGAL